MLLSLPDVLQLGQEQMDCLQFLLSALKSLDFTLHKLLGLVKKAPNILNVVASWNMLCWRWSWSLAGLGLSRVDGSLWNTKLVREFSYLLAICSKSQADGAKVEDTGSAALLLLVAILSGLRWSCVPIRRLYLRLRWSAGSNSQGCDASLWPTSARTGDRCSARWAHLLPLQPALETAEVQDMPARQFLGPDSIDRALFIGHVPWAHFFAADDARVLPGQVLL